MIFRGRNLDVLALWESLGIDLPDLPGDNLPTYMPVVQCPNPDHDTFKKHFQINTRQPYVHCFARCGISGDYEHAVAMILGLKTAKGNPDFKAARRYILRYTGVALKGSVTAYGIGTRKSFDADSAVAQDEKRLNAGEYQYLPKRARDYLDARGIDAAARGKWQIGYDEDAQRIVIPAYDERGNFRFIIRRQLDGGGSFKYLYTKGIVKTNILFGASYLDRDALQNDGLILVEGSLDVIRLHQLGFRNAVGILGTGISRKQVRLICQFDPKRIYDFFDKDMAGVANIQATQEQLTKFPIFVMRYPSHRSDPAEMTREEVARSIKRALPMAQFYKIARNGGTNVPKQDARQVRLFR
jgi:5S rRNA maturation endonuclease (ribonuclease M5)